jgi:hypothetical protein
MRIPHTRDFATIKNFTQNLKIREITTKEYEFTKQKEGMPNTSFTSLYIL